MEKTTQISENLYQFTSEDALIIVAAKQEGRAYWASNGKLQPIDEFRISTPHFSDNESLTNARGKQENTTEEIIHTEYFNHFKKLLQELLPSFKPTHIYLFAPTHTANELEEIIKPVFGVLPIKTVTGIFTKESPFELIGRLS